MYKILALLLLLLFYVEAGATTISDGYVVPDFATEWTNTHGGVVFMPHINDVWADDSGATYLPLTDTPNDIYSSSGYQTTTDGPYTVPYTWYVDNTGSCSDATQGTVASPRCTPPPNGTLTAGDVVVFAGGGTYAMHNFTTLIDGTATQPVIMWGKCGLSWSQRQKAGFRATVAEAQHTRTLGNCPTLTFTGHTMNWLGEHTIIDGFHFQDFRPCVGGCTLANTSFNIIRNSFLDGSDQRDASGGAGTHFALYRNLLGYNGGSDKGGYTKTGDDYMIFILQNEFAYFTGQAVQGCNVGSDCAFYDTDGVTVLRPKNRNAYIDQNYIHHGREAGIATKMDGFTMISRNKIFGMIDTGPSQRWCERYVNLNQYDASCPVKGTSGTSGEGMTIGANGGQVQQEDLWVLWNDIFDNHICGAFERTQRAVIAHNICHNGNGSDSSAAVMNDRDTYPASGWIAQASNNQEMVFFNNTGYEVDIMFGDRGGIDWDYFNNVAVNVDYFIKHGNSSNPACANNFEADNNLVYSDTGSVLISYCSNGTVTVNESSDLNGLIQNSLQAHEGNIWGDPLFINPVAVGGNFKVPSGSPALDNGFNLDLAAIDAQLTVLNEGLASSIQVDYEGSAVPGANIDIGAFQTAYGECSQHPALTGIPDPRASYTGTEVVTTQAWGSISPCGDTTPAQPQSWTDTGSGTSETPTYYYVCPSCPGASNSNTYGHPQAARVTHPDPIPAGAKVFFAGIIDSGNFQPSSTWRFVSQGTSSDPVWLVGVPGHELRNKLELESGGYLIADSLNFTAATGGAFVILAGGNVSHVAVRNSTFADMSNVPGIRIGFSDVGTPATIENIITTNNTYLRLGNWQNTVDTEDYGILMSSLSSSHVIQNVWILDSSFSYLGMGSYRIDAGAAQPDAIRNIFIGGNTSHHNRRSGGDIRNSRNVVVSTDEIFEMRQHGGNDSGTGLHIQGRPENGWLINSFIHNSDRGVRQANTTGADTSVFTLLGNYFNGIQYRQDDTSANAATNALGVPGSGSSRFGELSCPTAQYGVAALINGNQGFRVLQNTIRNTTLGLASDSNDRLDIHGILFGAPASSLNCYELRLGNAAATADKYSLDYNHFENTTIAASFDGVIHTSLTALSNAVSTGSGECTNCQAGDPLFVLDDLISDGSPVLNQSSADIRTNDNATVSTYQICSDYQTKLGIDICFDRAGQIRPIGANWDIGSRERAAATDTDPPSITAILPASGSTVNADNFLCDVTFDEAVSGVDATDFALTGAGCSGASKGTLIVLSSSRYQVPVTGASTGSCTCTVASGTDDIQDAAGNDLDPVSAFSTFNIVTQQQSAIPKLIRHLYREL